MFMNKYDFNVLYFTDIKIHFTIVLQVLVNRAKVP